MAGAMQPGGQSGGPGGINNIHGGNGQPHATEYTLQGVMRFLQTEWHRHERDRNAWEIEKQEMKGRIANLEGAARRADATQKALKKYVTILESKVKDQGAKLKAAAAGEKVDDEPTKSKRLDREALIQAKLRSTSEKNPNASDDLGVDLDRIDDDESQRSELKNFLDQCQSEFTYLMITPANPVPPRESPPLPILDEMRDNEAYGLPNAQQTMEHLAAARRQSENHIVFRSGPQGNNSLSQPMQAQSSTREPMRNSEIQQPQPVGPQQGLMRGDNNQQSFASSADWLSVSGPGRTSSEASEQNHSVKPLTRMDGGGDGTKPEGADQDAWDFNDGSFPDPAPHSQQTASGRPDTDVFPAADNLPKSPNRSQPLVHRRKASLGASGRRRSSDQEMSLNSLAQQKAESGNFKLRFGLRGHLNTVRTVIFSGGGSPGEPEICTAGDDGLIKRFHIPRSSQHVYNNAISDLDVQADFTHRGHNGAVLCLASWSPSPNFTTGGRAQGDGWIFSGGQDSTVRVWERGRVDPKATLDGHTDSVWTLCVLPATLGSVFGATSPYGSPDRILLASGAADGTVRIWAVSQPPQMTSPQPPPASIGRRAGGSNGRSRGNSMSSGSAFPSSPQPTIASNSPFDHTLVHTITRENTKASPTCISALSASGESFVVSYSDAAILVYDTRTGEEIGSMASQETYDGTLNTSVNAVAATTVGLDQSQHQSTHGGLGMDDDEPSGSGAGPTGGSKQMAGSGVEGTIISGHEDRFVRFFDANSGQCTYTMVAHPAAISSLTLSPDGRELVSAGHDASLRFWSLEKRSCTQEITSHRVMRGEGVCAVVWSQDARWVVSGGGDGVVKVFAR